MLVRGEVSGVVVQAALAVHRALGPGLLESAYAAAMQLDLAGRGVRFESEWPIAAEYKGRPLGVAYRADLLVEGELLVEIKAVGALDPLHSAQLLTYLRLARIPVGLLLNFNTLLMKDGIRRVLNTPHPSVLSASPLSPLSPC